MRSFFSFLLLVSLLSFFLAPCLIITLSSATIDDLPPIPEQPGEPSFPPPTDFLPQADDASSGGALGTETATNLTNTAPTTPSPALSTTSNDSSQQTPPSSTDNQSDQTSTLPRQDLTSSPAQATTTTLARSPLFWLGMFALILMVFYLWWLKQHPSLPDQLKEF